jgi:hypothetical protein
MVVASAVNTLQRFLFVVGGIGLLLAAYGWSIRVGDRGRPRSSLSGVHYDQAPRVARIRIWLAVAGLVGGCALLALRHSV